MQLGLDNSLKILNECDDNSTEKTATDINQAMVILKFFMITMLTYDHGLVDVSGSLLSRILMSRPSGIVNKMEHLTWNLSYPHFTFSLCCLC